MLGSGKMIVNYKEVDGRTISLDPEKGLMVDDVVVDPKNSENLMYQDEVSEKDFEAIRLITDNGEKMIGKEVKKESKKKKALFLLGTICVIGAFVVVLKGLKHNDD